MAAVPVTHADLEIDPRQARFSDKLAIAVIPFCSILGLTSFVLCLIAETTRSQCLLSVACWVTGNRAPSISTIPFPQAIWLSPSIWSILDVMLVFVQAIWGYVQGDNGDIQVEMFPRCKYIGNVPATLGYATGGLLAVVISLAMGHAFMGLAFRNRLSHRSVSSSTRIWVPKSAIPATALRWQAAIFFILSWISFAVTAVLLLIGIWVESKLIQDHRQLHTRCLVVGQGQFAAAGVFALASSSLGVALYVSAVNALRPDQTDLDISRVENFDANNITTPSTSAIPPPDPSPVGLQPESGMPSVDTKASPNSSAAR